MDDIKKHLKIFPPVIRSALENFRRWDQICEIRLRKDSPLSLTSFEDNILIDALGRPCSMEKALCTGGEDLHYVLGAFCGGSVYRYFHHLSKGFAVSEDGWRLGLCTERESFYNFLPESPSGINIRIPRFFPHAADDLLPYFNREGVSSTLILSKPGSGKTTLLRALALALSSGKVGNPLRIAVIDEREELFPKKYKEKGLVDLLSGYDKKTGIETAVRLFSPQVILCDEVGNEKEIEALISSCTGGVKVIASCHADGLCEARKIKFLQPILDSGLFKKSVTIRQIKGPYYKRELIWENIL